MDLSWTLTPFDPDDAWAESVWSELAQRCGGSPVLLPGFVFECARTMGSGALKFAVCRRGESIVAAAIVQRHGRAYPEVFVESQMPLGAWLQAPEEDFVELVRGLTQSCGPALRLGVAQVDPRFVPRPPEDESLQTFDYIQTAWCEFEGTFEAYWAARGKNLRTNMRRQRDKLAAQGTATRMEILTAPEDMARGVIEYARLESSGWKAELGTAVSETHPQTVFYRRMLEGLARAGQARIYRYFFDDRLVATEFCIVDGPEMVILKTTHDETVHPFSPASLLRQEMFAALFEQGTVKRVEFYGPLKEWHTRWTSLARTIYHVNAYRFAQVRQIETWVRRGIGKRLPAQALPSAAADSAGRAAVRAGWTRMPYDWLAGAGAEQWDRLCAEHAGAHPVFDSRFVFTVLGHFPHRELLPMVLGEPAKPRGMVLLERVAPGVLRNLQRSQLQVTAVMLSQADFELLPGLFDALSLGTLAIEFLNQDLDYVRWPLGESSGATFEVLDAGRTGTIALKGDFDAYWHARPRKLREDISRYTRHLSDEGRPVRLRVVEDAAGIDEAVRQFGLLESQGWKAAGGTAVHPDNEQGRFYLDAFGQFAADNRAVAYELVAGRDVIARQLALATGRVMVTLKTTYDERFRRYGPGRVLDYEMLRYEFERRRFATVELCTRADEMQLRWATTSRPIVHVAMYRSPHAKRWIETLRRIARGVGLRRSAVAPAETSDSPA